MFDRNWNPDEGLCPLACKKYRAATANEEAAKKALQLMHEQQTRLLSYRNQLFNLCEVANEGFQLLGVENKQGMFYAVLMRDIPAYQQVQREVYLVKLPYEKDVHKLCKMYLDYWEGGKAHIIDWHSRFPNQGYGSILMKHLISFLTAANFKCITGCISPCDFDHEDKLRHFYTKFGFRITDHPDRRSLFLDLTQQR